MSDAQAASVRHVAARYGTAVLAVALALLVRWGLNPYLGDHIPYPFFFLAVTLVAWWAGSGPALLSMVLGLLAADWFFIPPHYSLAFGTLGDAVGAGSFLLTSLAIIIISHAMHRARAQALSRQAELEAEVAERKQVEAALKDAKETLEQRVAERTADLAESEAHLETVNQSLERRVIERTAEVQRLADQLRALAVELTQAESRERRRLAAVLHDHLQQLLVSAQIQLGLVRRADAGSIRSTVQGIESIIKEAVTAARSLAVELSPPVLDQAGLAAALAWLAKRMEEKDFFKVHVLADHDAEPAMEEVRSLLFESVRELLLNAVKHSGVQEAGVTMERTGDGWTKVVVEDKGKGFNPSVLQATKASDMGFGLFSIQQRLAYAGGRMELESAPGRGTKVTLLAPPGKLSFEEGAPARSPGAGEAAGLRERAAKVRVLIVDDHKIIRQGLVGLLQFETDMEIVGEAGDGQQAVGLARELRPHVVIMDVNLPGMSGVEATKILSTELPQTKIIGLSMHTDPAVSEAMRRAGAVAYLTKEDLSQDLLAAIRACASRGRG